jgi:hypothetical protein
VMIFSPRSPFCVPHHSRLSSSSSASRFIR